MIRLVSLLSLILFSACGTSTQGELLLLHGTYFGIPFEVAVPKDLPKKDQATINQIVKDVFAEINLHCNHWNPDSELTGMNHKGTYHISPILGRLFTVALFVHRTSLGLFDPSASGNARVWKKTKVYKRCQGNHFSDVMSLENEVYLPASMQFDFDGILKGFAVDEIARKMRDAGYHQFLINWSGEIYASGRHPAGRKWVVFLSHAKKGVELENEALATSGSTYNIWEHKGGVVTHIYNPFDKKLTDPRIRPEAITVKALSCAEADGFATAYYVNPNLNIQEKGILLIK